MAKIPDGPARIKIVSRKDGKIQFQFTSFPEDLRQGKDWTLRCNNRLWKIISIAKPEMGWNGCSLYCPGNIRNLDTNIVDWTASEQTLHEIIRAINERVGAKYEKHSWPNLCARVAAWRTRNG